MKSREMLRTLLPGWAKDMARDALAFVRFFGFARYCPLCMRHLRAFLPSSRVAGQETIDRYAIVSMGARKEYRCPWCNSSDKERHVWAYLLASGLLRDGICILHIAPEKNTKRRLRAIPGVTYVAGDKFEAGYEGKYADTVPMDVTDIPAADESYDLVICNHVLEHVIDDRKAMKEIYRVLKPGGTAILNVPVSHEIEATIEHPSADPLKDFGQTDHVRIYAQRDYVRRLEDTGFTVIARRIDAPRWGLNPEEDIYVCRK